MSKPKIPVELQAILKELCIEDADEARLLRKVHTRAAMQVKDYLSIIVSKLELHARADTALAQTIDDTRRILQHVEQREHAAEEHDEADVVVHERA
jgi:hypothetical protein